jgi:hypothetical protein
VGDRVLGAVVAFQGGFVVDTDPFGKAVVTGPVGPLQLIVDDTSDTSWAIAELGRVGRRRTTISSGLLDVVTGSTTIGSEGVDLTLAPTKTTKFFGLPAYYRWSG